MGRTFCGKGNHTFSQSWEGIKKVKCKHCGALDFTNKEVNAEMHRRRKSKIEAKSGANKSSAGTKSSASKGKSDNGRSSGGASRGRSSDARILAKAVGEAVKKSLESKKGRQESDDEHAEIPAGAYGQAKPSPTLQKRLANHQHYLLYVRAAKGTGAEYSDDIKAMKRKMRPKVAGRWNYD